MKEVPPNILKRIIRYDQATGELFWLKRPRGMFKSDRDCKAWNTRYSDKPAMTANNGVGYRVGQISGSLFCAHRVIWALVHDEWPDKIDHINGDSLDNRLENLRSVSVSGNGKNSKLSSRNNSGVIGVFWDKRRGKWSANIKSEGKSYFLGYHDRLEDAVKSRKEASLKFGFHENHGRVQ